MNQQTTGHLLMLSGAIHEIAENSKDFSIKGQLKDVANKVEIIASDEEEGVHVTVGDKFIYKSKYGGVVKGEIQSFTFAKSYDTNNAVILDKHGIISTNGGVYDLSEIEIVSKFLTDEECENIIKVGKMLRSNKEKSKQRMEQLFNDFKETLPPNSDAADDISMIGGLNNKR